MKRQIFYMILITLMVFSACEDREVPPPVIPHECVEAHRSLDPGHICCDGLEEAYGIAGRQGPLFCMPPGVIS